MFEHQMKSRGLGGVKMLNHVVTVLTLFITERM